MTAKEYPEAWRHFHAAWRHFHESASGKALFWQDCGNRYTEDDIEALYREGETYPCYGPEHLYGDLVEKLADLQAEAAALEAYLR